MRIRSLIALAGTTVLVPGLVGFAPASEWEDATTVDRAAIAQSLTEMGVAPSVQIELIDNLEAGVLWDSLSGAEPVETTSQEIDGVRVDTLIYEDGSRAVVETEIPTVDTGEISPSSTSACTVPLGPYPYGWSFSNCRISVSVALIDMSYYIDGVTRGSSASYPPKVTRAINLDYRILGGSFVSETLDRPRPTGTSTLSAQARGRVVINYPAQGGTVTMSLYANVGSDITATSS